MERYKSIEEMRAEFGDYRVSDKTETLCDSSVSYSPAENEVKNDSYNKTAAKKTDY